MKLLCDVCENAAASVICCADEAVLCSSCDVQVHAANKLATRHPRVLLLSELPNPAMCDICQEKPSFFLCIEDRALLCRDCDVSVHSANLIVAKHRKFIMAGIKVGMSTSDSTACHEVSSVVKHNKVITSPPKHMDLVSKKQAKRAMTVARGNCSKNDGNKGSGNKLSSYNTVTMDGTFSLASYSSTYNTDHRFNMAGTASTTTISIRRISELGRSVPFVAPVLSSIDSSLVLRKGSSTKDFNKQNNKSMSTNSRINLYSNSNGMMVEDSPTVNVFNHLTFPNAERGHDELLKDIFGLDSAASLCPPKEIDPLPCLTGSQQAAEEQFCALEAYLLEEQE